MKYLFFTTIVLLLFSCAQRHYVNDSGTVRPLKKKVFSYAKRFKKFSPQIDTNAIYVRHWQYQSFNGVKDRYEYYRFFGGGQIIWSGIDSTLNLSNVNNLKKGLIGRYYFKEDQLRIQLFYPVSISRSISKTYGFVKDGNIFTYNETPETWYGSYGLTKSFGKDKMQEWKKQEINLNFSSRPDW